MPPESQKVRVDLEKTITYLEGQLVRLSVGKDPRGLIPVHCKATSCVLLPASAGRTLVHLEGPDSEDKSLRDKFTYEGEKNGYGYTSMLTQEGGESMVPPVGVDKWKTVAGERASTFGVALRIPSSTTRFSQMRPEQFGLRDDAREDPLREAEAVLKNLPRPSP